MTDTMTITDAPADGETPIFDTDRLKARIAKLGERGLAELRERWVTAGLGEFSGLVDAATYTKAERLVYGCEVSADLDAAAAAAAVANVTSALDSLPPHIKASAEEALRVYAGTTHPGKIMLASQGRWDEIQRIVGEAVAYAVSLGVDVAIPSVADLPPVDDQAEQLASADYPGTKADAKTVLAWVGQDRNRAARAYALEQERSTVRKGVTAKLVEILGEDGLAKVTEALASATPPPLDLSAGSPAVPAAPADETGAAGPGVVPPETSVGATAPTSEAEPAAPTPRTTVVPFDTAKLVANALDLIAEGFAALAFAVREGE